MKFRMMIPALALAASVLAISVNGSQAARICKSRSILSVNSIPSPTRSFAKANAEARWGTRVTQTYSLQWSNWANATSKKHYCNKTTTVIGANVWRCRARARPCIYQ